MDLNPHPAGPAEGEITQYYQRGLEAGQRLAYQQVLALLPWLEDEFAQQNHRYEADARAWYARVLRFLNHRITETPAERPAHQLFESGEGI